MDNNDQYSAYTLDPEHGWVATHRLPLESALKMSREYYERTAGALVAVIPDGEDPDPILKHVEKTHPKKGVLAKTFTLSEPDRVYYRAW